MTEYTDDPLEKAYLEWLASPDAKIDGGPSMREVFRAGMIYGLSAGIRAFTSEFATDPDSVD